MLKRGVAVYMSERREGNGFCVGLCGVGVGVVWRKDVE